MISNEKVTGLRIEFDYSEGDSRSWDNLTRMVCFYNGYNLGDKHSYNKNDYNSFEELKEAIEENENVLVIKPLYLYNHSGLTISTEPFNCHFDSGQIGWVYVTKETQELTGAPMDSLEEQLIGEVKTYDQELRNDVYSFTCFKNGEVADSCGGFYGTNLEENGMLGHIPDEFIKLLEEHKVTEVVID
jgi:hypothetical protein